MKARRIVIDTNVLISAALLPQSKPALVTQILLEQGRLVFSEETFTELETRLWRPKFDKYLSIEQRRLLLHDFSAVADWVELNNDSYPRLSPDVDDDKFIYTALAGSAEWLVSGDRDLLDLPKMQDLVILSPADAFRRLKKSKAG